MTYKKLPGLTWDGTIYENEEMGTLEALLPTGGYPTPCTCHGRAARRHAAVLLVRRYL